MHVISLRSSFVLFTVLPALALAQTPVEEPVPPAAPLEAPTAPPAEPIPPPAAAVHPATEASTSEVSAPAMGLIEATAQNSDGVAVKSKPSGMEASLAVATGRERGAVLYSPATDTRLTFVFADDNVLAGPGETDEPSPGPQFSAGASNNLFFESYETRDSGFETLTHFVLFKESATYFDGLTGTAALVLRVRGRISDSSSYVQLRYQPRGWGDDEHISFTGFPISSDRFRLGYSYRLTWGGADIFTQRVAGVPGARFQITRDRWYFWIGAKSTVIDEPQKGQAEQNTVRRANHGALAAVGVDILDELRIEANGGIFTRGVFQSEPLTGERMYTGGASFQVAYHVGREVGTSIDLKLYRNDPLENQTYFKPVEYDDGIDYVIKAEMTLLATTLENPDRFGSTTMQFARAGDVNFALRQKANRYFLDFEFRDLSYILLNVPGLVPRQDFTEETRVFPEWFVALGYDHYFEMARLTPGFRVGIWRPAYTITDRLPVGPEPPASLTGDKTVIVRREGDLKLLPDDASVTPILAAQLTLRFDIADFMALLAEVAFALDNNRATFIKDQSGANVYVFVDPAVLSFNMVLQARF